MDEKKSRELGDLVTESVKENVVGAVIHARAKSVASSGFWLYSICVVKFRALLTSSVIQTARH